MLCGKFNTVLESGGELTLTQRDSEALTALAFLSSGLYLNIGKYRDADEVHIEFLGLIEKKTQNLSLFSGMENVAEKLAEWFHLPKKYRPMTETAIICAEAAANKGFTQLSPDLSATKLKSRISAGERMILEQGE